MTGRQLRALPREEQKAYWNDGYQAQCRNLVDRSRTTDRNVQTESLEALFGLLGFMGERDRAA